MKTVDLNCDLGEGFGAWEMGNDAAMIELATSVNVACGFHAGDPGIMRQVCAGAVANGVAIGAQVGYRDLAGFGRRRIDVDPGELRDEVLYQIGALSAFGPVSYVKPHGALYNRAARDPAVATVIAAAVGRYDPGLPLLLLAGSPGAAAAGAVGECFADRAYTPEGRLVSRREPGAVLTDPDEVVDRAVRMAAEGTVTATDGSSVAVDAASICVHGDTPGAAELARRVRAGLAAAGIAVAPFAQGATR
jgi:5-oxoprolinase (ATP-hydrolysing) subunit A